MAGRSRKSSSRSKSGSRRSRSSSTRSRKRSSRSRSSSSRSNSGSHSGRGSSMQETRGSDSSSAGRSRRSNTTTDHDQIRRWAEERGGRPACVRGTGGGNDTGIIRIEFPGAPNAKDSKLEEIGWDEFFQKFDSNGLALVYEETTTRGARSNFNKLVGRGGASSRASSSSSSRTSRSSRSSSGAKGARRSRSS
jgi:hypothetical protein